MVAAFPPALPCQANSHWAVGFATADIELDKLSAIFAVNISGARTDILKYGTAAERPQAFFRALDRPPAH